MFRFATPAYLGLLAPLALAAWRRARQGVQPALRFSELGAGLSLLPIPSLALRLRPVVDGLRYAAMALLVLALAGPQWGQDSTTILSQGVNIVLCVDVSETMAALDFKAGDKVLNRLQAVKNVVNDFIQRREADRIGLVVFGSEAYTQLPLTRDYKAIAQALDRIEIGAAGSMTAIGDALGIGVKRLKDVESKSNVLILLTDGRSNAGELPPETAADIAARAGVKVYTIGVGGKEPAPFLVQDPVFGRRVVYQAVEIDEATLRSIAEKTGGLYFRAENTDGLKRIYATIDKLEKNEAKVKVYGDYRELYPWFVLPALVLIGLWLTLTHTRFLRLP